MASFRSNLFFHFLLSLTAVAAVCAAETTHLHFYMHDTLTGPPDPSAVQVVKGTTLVLPPLLRFGDITVIDDPLTEGPNLTSALVGRAQGFYTSVSLSSKDPTFLLAMNIVFTKGEYNGSTLAVHARDSISSPVRELPVVGGSGLFRLARGYALMKTYFNDPSNGNAILEWDLYAMN